MHSPDLPEQMAARLSDDRLAIYLFHGVIERQVHPVRNYTGKHIEAGLFGACMKRMAQEGTALSMDQVLDYCRSGERLPKRAYAITFDDGFANNLSVAAPIMTDLDIPMMIYLTSRFVDENGMSWIDRIEYAVEDAPAQTLEVAWNDAPFRLDDADSRIAFLKGVRRYVKSDPKCDADRYTDDLCARLGKPGRLSTNDPLDRKLTWQQVNSLLGDRLVQFGGHSHTHRIMSFLSPQELAQECDLSIGLMRDKAGLVTGHYSYPEGLAHCFSEDVIAALKQRGITCCPTAMDGVNQTGADPFHLRRIMVA